jgi:hypothetical protein
MHPRLLHLDDWLIEFLKVASKRSGISVNGIIRLGCYSYIIEFAKASGYVPTIDSRSAFLMMEKNPCADTIKKVTDLFQHEARNAASFRIAKKAIITRASGSSTTSKRTKKLRL